jgi:glucokinase
MRKGQVLAVDLGGTNVRLGMVTRDGRILRRRRTRIPVPADRESLYEALAGRIGEFIQGGEVGVRGGARGGARDGVPWAVAVGFAGPTHSAAGHIYTAPNVGGLSNIRLGEELKSRLGLPVVVANDANCAALGEFFHGAGVGSKSLFMFTLGTGVGGGFVIDGKIWEGAWGIAGEIGHTIVAADGPRCNCGNRGCLEALASGSAVVRDYIGKSRIRSEAGRKAVTAKFVFDKAKHGDRIAARVVADAAKALGVGIANVFHLVNPEVIVIGGGVSRAGGRLIRPATECAREHVFSPLRDKLKVRKAKLGDDGGLLGAARLAYTTLGSHRDS